MSRNAIEVDQAIFERLRRFEAQRGSGRLPAGVRWIAGESADEEIVTKTPVLRSVRFGRHRAVVVLEVDDRTQLGLLGFEFSDWPLLTPAVEVEAISSGYISLLLFASEVSPSSTASQVLNVVGAASKADDAYAGHSPEAIASIFPIVRLVDMGDRLEESLVWPQILKICVTECAQSGSWIEEELSSSLRQLAELNLERFPYESLARSIFDLDPRSVFLAIYRVIEATYAFDSSNRLSRKLSLSEPWYSVAEILAAELGWHPRHGDALNALLREAAVSDAKLRELCSAIGVTVGDDAAASAGRAVRELRNAIVHFGPTMVSVEIEKYDWNRLCVALIDVLNDVFQHAYAAGDS